MLWTEIKLKVPVEKSDEAAAIANMTVPYGIFIEDYSDLETQSWEIAHVDLIDEELINKDRNTAIIHIYIPQNENIAESLSFLRERFAACNIEYQAATDSVDQKDWENNWKKYFKCTEIGKRLCIRPSWENYINSENRAVLSIDPGAAFGTGTHATTSMCLELLDALVKNGETVLDIGCGSGILSIASVLLGAKSATGIDIDEVAVKVATENALLNGISQKTEYIVGDLNDKISSRYDIVCANIVADVIMKLAPDVTKLLNKDGIFICSGIIDLRADEVRQSLYDNGLEIIKEVTESNWVAIVSKAKKYIK